MGTRFHRVPGSLIAALFGAALAWGLLRFGAAETRVLYQLFLLLLLPALIAAFSPRLAKPKALLPLLLVGLFLLAHTALQPTLEGLGFIHLSIGWMALFLTVRLASDSQRWARNLLLFLIVLGGAEAAYGMVQSIGGVDAIGSYSRGLGEIATGTFINRNHFAGLLNMTLPLAVGALFTAFARRRSSRHAASETYALTWIVLLCCSLMGLAVLLSQSRAGTVTLISSLLFLSLLLVLARRRSAGKSIPGLAAWIILFTVLGLGLSVGLEALLARFGRLGQEDLRIRVYRDSLELIADHPLLGVGPGMYRWRFRPYQTEGTERLYDHAHNDFLETAAEWGVPLALLFWGFVLRRFYRSARLFVESRHPVRQGIALGSATAIFSILLHSLFDFNLQIPANLAVLCTILGLAWSLEWTGRRSARQPASGEEARA